MKNKLFRRAAILTAALFSLTCMSVTAYAQSDEPAEETTPPAATETVAKPFTPDGTGTVVDNATDEDGNTFGVYPEEIAGLQRDYEKLWGQVSDVLMELSALVEK